MCKAEVVIVKFYNFNAHPPVFNAHPPVASAKLDLATAACPDDICDEPLVFASPLLATDGDRGEIIRSMILQQRPSLPRQ
jgi:hypothetical protein